MNDCYQSELRQRWRTFTEKQKRLSTEWEESGYSNPAPSFSEYLEEFSDLVCGARTKATGAPCKRRDIYANGRCRLHGGLSTGPRTEAGKRRCAQNGFKKRQPLSSTQTP